MANSKTSTRKSSSSVRGNRTSGKNVIDSAKKMGRRAVRSIKSAMPKSSDSRTSRSGRPMARDSRASSSSSRPLSGGRNSMNRGISSVRSAARRPVANHTGSRARTSTSSASRARRAA